MGESCIYWYRKGKRENETQSPQYVWYLKSQTVFLCIKPYIYINQTMHMVYIWSIIIKYLWTIVIIKGKKKNRMEFVINFSCLYIRFCFQNFISFIFILYLKEFCRQTANRISEKLSFVFFTRLRFRHKSRWISFLTWFILLELIYGPFMPAFTRFIVISELIANVENTIHNNNITPNFKKNKKIK